MKTITTRVFLILLCLLMVAFARLTWAMEPRAKAATKVDEIKVEETKVEEVIEVKEKGEVKEEVKVEEDVEVEEVVTEVNPYDNAMVTDRPDVADSSLTVGKFRFQIETSFEFTQDEEAGITTRTYSFPTLFRFGIIDPLEIRAEGSWFILQTQTGQRREGGFSDIALGLKWHVLDARSDVIPSLGLMTMVKIPTGASEVSSGAVEPEFKVLADFDLFYNFVLHVNLGVDVPVRDAVGDKYARFLYAAALGYFIHDTNNRARLFVEASGAVPMKSNKDNLISLNTGGSFLFTPNMQIDGFVRIGLSDATTDMVGGVGYSYRF